MTYRCKACNASSYLADTMNHRRRRGRTSESVLKAALSRAAQLAQPLEYPGEARRVDEPSKTDGRAVRGTILDVLATRGINQEACPGKGHRAVPVWVTGAAPSLFNLTLHITIQFLRREPGGRRPLTKQALVFRGDDDAVCLQLRDQYSRERHDDANLQLSQRGQHRTGVLETPEHDMVSGVPETPEHDIVSGVQETPEHDIVSGVPETPEHDMVSDVYIGNTRTVCYSVYKHERNWSLRSTRHKTQMKNTIQNIAVYLLSVTNRNWSRIAFFFLISYNQDIF